MKIDRFVAYVWGVLAYNLAVILWGAYVRATGSGAGCGSHWPLCNGQVIPRAHEIETLIEFSHRVTTSLAGLLVIGLVVWATRRYPRDHQVRRGAWLSLFFIILEGLVGAGQVRLGLVADNASPARAVIGSIHLVNTFLLVGALTLTGWWASGGRRLQLAGQGALGVGFLIALSATLVLGMSGSITALGDTLFPVDTLHEGLQQDLSPTAHFLIRLRVFHPMIAVVVSIYSMVLAWQAAKLRPNPNSRPFAIFLTALIVIQLLAGAINVVLLAPVWMQLVHLLLANLMWIGLVLNCALALAETPAEQASSVGVPVVV